MACKCFLSAISLGLVAIGANAQESATPANKFGLRHNVRYAVNQASYLTSNRTHQDRTHHSPAQHHDHHRQGRWYPFCFPTVIYTGTSYGYGYDYGSYAQDDSTTTYLLQEQNALLAEQLAELRAQNRALRAERDPKGNAAKQAPARPDRARRSAQSGLKLFKAGQYRRAAERFRDALGHDDTDATLQFYLAQALFAGREYAEAATALKAGLKANPDWPKLAFDLRGLYGDPDAILAQLGELARELHADPLDRDRLLLFGFELMMTGQQAKARGIFDRLATLDLEPAYLDPFLNVLADHP